MESNKLGVQNNNKKTTLHLEDVCLTLVYEETPQGILTNKEGDTIKINTQKNDFQLKRERSGLLNFLTSPSVDSSCRSFRPLTFSGPLAALTSTPLGASMVRVRVGDSSLGGERARTQDEFYD